MQLPIFPSWDLKNFVTPEINCIIFSETKEKNIIFCNAMATVLTYNIKPMMYRM